MNTVAIIIASVVVIGMGVLAVYTEYGGSDGRDKKEDKDIEKKEKSKGSTS